MKKQYKNPQLVIVSIRPCVMQNLSIYEKAGKTGTVLSRESNDLWDDDDDDE